MPSETQRHRSRRQMPPSSRSDDEPRAQPRIHFLKNLGLLGGLILQASETSDTDSTRRPSPAVRSRRSKASDKAATRASKAAALAGRYLGTATDHAGKLVSQAHDQFGHLGAA